jgi:hypothetical protein
MLWYWADWNSGTTILSRHLKGCYMDLLHAQFNNGHLSLEEIKAVLGSDFETAWPTLKKKFKADQEGLFFNSRLDFEKEKRAAYTQSRRDAKAKDDNDLVRVYLVRDNDTGFTKVGFSVNPDRRLAELMYQKDPAISLTEAGKRRYERLFVSEPVERKLEKQIHAQFKSVRMKGEWFDLSDKDLNTLLRTFFQTSMETIKRTTTQTNQRTDNRNENENEDVIIIKNEVGDSLEFSYSVKPDRSQIEKEIFKDERFITDLQITHHGKDIKAAWNECWNHHSQKPRPPEFAWEWKQKLNSWLTIKRKDNERDRNTNQGTTTPASTIQRPGKAFGKL